MPRILFQGVHRPDRSPSQRFRYEQYLSFLKENGFEYDYSYLLNEKDDKVFYSYGNTFGKISIMLKSLMKRYSEISKAKEYDIVFVQRESVFLGTSFFERQYSKSKAKLVFDFDDAIWIPNVSAANRKFAFLKNSGKTADIIRVSDFVFAGNQYLADYASQYNKNVAIVPTTIDTQEYKRMTLPPNDKITIGWSGSITTIQHFQTAIPVLKRVKEKYGDSIAIKVIGDGNFKVPELDIQGLPWSKKDEIRELSSFDLGIMPLPDDKWAKGKCGLKGLQYMALGIPTIMSPVGVNTEIIQDSVNGFLASSEDEWFEKICQLIENESLRLSMGEEGRKTVEMKYSVNANKQLYLDLFRKIAAIQK